MTIRLTWLLFLLGVAWGMLAAPGLAALPPLTLAELTEMADVIVTATVESLKQEQRVKGIAIDGPDPAPAFVDTVYTLAVKVQSVQKGEGLAAGQKVQLVTWQPKKRPEGFAGPQGQNFIPKKGQAAQFFCRRAGEVLKILEPNGILKDKPVTP